MGMIEYGYGEIIEHFHLVYFLTNIERFGVFQRERNTSYIHLSENGLYKYELFQTGSDELQQTNGN
jgi:hypothetical protein